MSNSETYYRLIIRFTNGETEKFILREPVDTSRLSNTCRYVLVRAREDESDDPIQVFLACLDDVSYIKVSQIDAKETRHRVAGMTGALGIDENKPESIATVEFL